MLSFLPRVYHSPSALPRTFGFSIYLKFILDFFEYFLHIISILGIIDLKDRSVSKKEDIMAKKLRCPYCKSAVEIREVYCANCDTTIRTTFEENPFSRLSEEELDLAYRMIIERGNLKKLEAHYSISYPTLRNRVTKLVESLSGKPCVADDAAEDALSGLESGTLNVEEALRILKGGKREE